MLGFDESTDVVLEESNSQKCMKVTRDINYAGVESSVEFDREVCCNCRKLDYKHRKVEPPEDGHHCMTGTSAKPMQTKLVKDDRINDKIAYKVSQEAFHHVLNSKSVSSRIPDNLSQEGIKASGSKHPSSASPNTAAGAQMLIKKFSYSNMPKQLKELVSPTDFYNIVKKELERCETEAKKPYNPVPTAENYESSNSTQVGSIQSKKASYKTYKPRNEANAIPTAERRGSSTRQDFKLIDEDFENLTITELLNREKAGKLFPKKDAKPSASTVSSSKVCKNTNHAKIKETKSLSKSEEVLPQSKPKLSNSHANCKGPRTLSNASSDEINSSDSVVTASDNVSSRSSVSSSSSNKSHGKLSDVTDASTFGEIESIADAEVVSEAFLPVGSIIESVKSSVNTVTSGPTSSHSSTLKDASESKSNKSNKSAISGSSAKDLSKKDDSSSKTNTPPQGKGKNANKHKNRPKSNSSKSSSIPSLSDITTVSSKSLKTYSVMKQIPGSDDDKSKGKK